MTLNDDLIRMSVGMRGLTAHDVAQVDGSVYVNFDHATALTMTPEITSAGRVWYLTVTEWDRTGGVHREIDLGEWPEHAAMERAAGWLREWDAEQERREAELEGIPE